MISKFYDPNNIAVEDAVTYIGFEKCLGTIERPAGLKG